MTSPRTYWVGQRFAAEWTLVNTAGSPVVGATVAGQVLTPAGGAAPMAVTADGNVYTATYTVTAPGRHGYQLQATGAAVDAFEGEFTAHTTLTGAPPITTDPTTDIGMVRLLATDLDEITPLFTDEQVTAFLAMEGGVKRAAALALETTAVSEALISKRISTQDLTTDGPAVAAELRQRAAALRAQAKTDDDQAAADAAWDLSVVDFDPSASYRWW